VSRRWDIAIRVLSGPTASRDVMVYRGPSLTIGTNPGPGGLVIPAGRGVAPQHCTISAYDRFAIHVTPVGHNPVRIAPYPDAHWDEVEPIHDRTHLARGMALHIGPAGQLGVTLEFVECRDLGLQTSQRLASESVEAGRLAERPPDGIAARVQRPAVRKLLTDSVDPTLFRVLVALFAGGTGLAAVVGVVLAAFLWSTQPPSGEAFWLEGDFSFKGELTLHEGFALPVLNFVVAPNRAAVRDPAAHPELFSSDPRSWDPRFFGLVERQVLKWSQRPNLYKRFDEVKDHYATVTRLLREADLPEVLAGIPMTESCYKPDVVSPCCAKGWWQWMVEGGPRFLDEPGFGERFAVAECSWKGDAAAPAYTPKNPAPVLNSCHPTHPRADYLAPGNRTAVCMLAGCKSDFRTDLELSTRASIHALGEAFRDPEIRDSGAATQITIASHNAGFDDARLFEKNPPTKKFNLLPSYRRWVREKPERTPSSHFYGDAMRCAGQDEVDESCQAFMRLETQEYAVKVVAQHLMAVCYYAQNYASEPVFAAWGQYLKDGEYCRSIPVPAPEELRKVDSGRVCPR
jgi:hypothetical protein